MKEAKTVMQADMYIRIKLRDNFEVSKMNHEPDLVENLHDHNRHHSRKPQNIVATKVTVKVLLLHLRIVAHQRVRVWPLLVRITAIIREKDLNLALQEADGISIVATHMVWPHLNRNISLHSNNIKDNNRGVRLQVKALTVRDIKELDHKLDPEGQRIRDILGVTMKLMLKPRTHMRRQRTIERGTDGLKGTLKWGRIYRCECIS